MIVGKCPIADGHYPFTRKGDYTFDVIRPHLHLRGHCEEFQSIFRARHFAAREFHNYFHDNGFFQVHTPILSSNSCEGAGEVIISKNAHFDQANKSDDSIAFR